MRRPHRLSATLPSLLLVPLLGAAACVGNIGGGGSSGEGGGSSGNGNGNGSPGQPNQPGNNNPGNSNPGNNNPGNGSSNMPGNGPGPSAADPNAAGPMPLRRLTRREYNNTVRDLLGDTSKPADGFPPDVEAEFNFRRAGLVATVDATRLGGAAEALATAAEAKLGELVPCTPAAAADEEGCARKFIESFGLRAYRRPLEGAEVDRHLKLYRDARGAAQLDFKGSIRLLIEAMLQSPHFIYRWELGPGSGTKEGQVVRLGPYEVASRLSYALWGSMPDQTLFEAAAGNRLATEADLEREARRMLNDPKARDAVVAFVTEWFGFDELANRPKDPKVYPEWKDDLKAAMTQEVEAFVRHVVFEGDGKLDSLLGASFSFVNGPLAAIYGLTGVTGSAMTKRDLDPAQRGGLLTTASWLTLTGATDGSHPIVRGKLVYERLLCGVLPPPPPDVPEPKPPGEGLTTRERFAEHSSNACATGCHAVMDPLGFAFEHFDGLGKYRTMDAGKAVDASGKVPLDGTEKSFKNARELTGLLVASSEARRCFATQMSRFAWNRHDVAADRHSIETAAAALDKGGGSIKELLVGIAKSRSFRYRTPAADEVLK